MDDSGGQGFGGVFAGDASVEERTAGGGRSRWVSSEWENCEELVADPLTGSAGGPGRVGGRRFQQRRRRRSDQLRLGVPRHTEPLSLGVAGAPRGIGICVGFGEAGGVAVEDLGAGALWAVGAGSLKATSGSAVSVLLDVSQDNAMDDSDILDGVGVLARDVVANERAEGVAALGAMVVDERFGSLLGRWFARRCDG